MDARAIREYLSADLGRVREIIRTSLQSDIDLLNATNRSILDNAGKMLRPSMALLVAKSCSGGYVSEDTYRYAAASELLHNATLLHDDVADNSASRRGMPTVMSLLGGRAAVLLGDFWLVKAMEQILEGTTDVIRVISTFSRTLSDLAEGEMLQLQKASSCDTDEDDYFRIIYNKTASLFVAAAVSSAISVGVPKNHEMAVRDFAENLGLAFQIRDDILDFTGGESLGKPVGQDIREQKITLPLLGAFVSCPGREAEIRAKVAAVQDCPGNQDEIVRFVREEGGIQYAEDRLDRYIENAVGALSALPDNEDKKVLAELARYAGNRSV